MRAEQAKCLLVTAAERTPHCPTPRASASSALRNAEILKRLGLARK